MRLAIAGLIVFLYVFLFVMPLAAMIFEKQQRENSIDLSKAVSIECTWNGHEWANCEILK